MQYVIVFALLLLAVILHEAGHAFAMNKYGIKLEKCGIGLPWPAKVRIPIGRIYGARVYFHPLLIGAYVEPEDGDLVEALPIGDQNVIYAAGVWVNMLCALGAYAIFAIGREMYIYGALALALTVLVLLARKLFSNFLVPLLGIAQIVLFATMVADMLSGGATTVASGTGGEVPAIAGPVGVVKIMGDFGLPYLFIFSMMSLALGLTNMLPLYPMDGGHIALNGLKKARAPRLAHSLVRVGGVVIFAVILVGVVISDISLFM